MVHSGLEAGGVACDGPGEMGLTICADQCISFGGYLLPLSTLPYLPLTVAEFTSVCMFSISKRHAK